MKRASFNEPLSQVGARITQCLWDGPCHRGEKALVMENAFLRATVLLKGAWVISVIDKTTGRDFINASDEGRNNENGIFDRYGPPGRPGSGVADPEHFRNRLYAYSITDTAAVRFTCQSDHVAIERTLSLAGSAPLLRVSVKLTNISGERIRTCALVSYQPNTGPAPVTYNSIVTFPKPDGEYVSNFDIHTDETLSDGWWYTLDRKTKEATVMVYPKDDPRVSSIYGYRQPDFFHCITFGPLSIIAPGQSLSTESDFVFLTGLEGVARMSMDWLALPDQAAEKLAASLKQAMCVPPFNASAPFPQALPVVDA